MTSPNSMDGGRTDHAAREAAIRQQQDHWAKLYEAFNGKPMPDELKGGANLPKEQQT